MRSSFSRIVVMLSTLLLSVSMSFSQSTSDPAPVAEEITDPPAVIEEVIVDGATDEPEATDAVVGESPSFDPLVATCTPHPDNTCLAPTQGYVTALSAQNLPAEDYTQALADLVVALVPLAPSGEQCGLVDSEIPDSIRYVASQATDAAQAAQFITIADTIADCVNFETAAIAPVASSN